MHDECSVQWQDVPRPRQIHDKGVVRLRCFPHVHVIRRDLGREIGVQPPIKESHYCGQHGDGNIRPHPPPLGESESKRTGHDQWHDHNGRVFKIVIHQHQRRVANGQLRREQSVHPSNGSCKRRKHEQLLVLEETVQPHQGVIHSTEMQGQIPVPRHVVLGIQKTVNRHHHVGNDQDHTRPSQCYLSGFFVQGREGPYDQESSENTPNHESPITNFIGVYNNVVTVQRFNLKGCLEVIVVQIYSAKSDFNLSRSAHPHGSGSGLGKQNPNWLR